MSDQWSNQPNWYNSQYQGYYPYPQPPAPPPPPPPEKPSLPSEPPPPPGTDVEKAEVTTSVSDSPLSATYPAWYPQQAPPRPTFNPTSPPKAPIRFHIAQPDKSAMAPTGVFTAGHSCPPTDYADAAARWNAANSVYSPYCPVTPTASPPTTQPTTSTVAPAHDSAVRPTNTAAWFNNFPPPSAATSSKGPRFPFKNVIQSSSMPPTPKTEPITSTPPNNQWSPELREYVQRAFTSTSKPEEKDQMECILKEKLEYIFRNKIQLDWSKEAIPAIPSRAINNVQNEINIPPPTTVNVIRPLFMPRNIQPRQYSSIRPTRSFDSMGGRNPYGENFSIPSQLFRPKTATEPIRKTAACLPGSGQKRQQRRRRSDSRSRSYSRSKSNSRSRSRSSTHSRSRSSSHSSRSSPSWRRHLHKEDEWNRRSRSPTGNDSRREKRRLMSRAFTKDTEEMGFSGNQRGGLSSKRGGKKGRGGVQTVTNTTASFNCLRSRGGIRGGKRGGKRGRGGSWNVDDGGNGQMMLNQRASRFKDHLGEMPSTMSGAGAIARSTSQLILTYADDGNDFTADFGNCQIIGTMEDLEKPYLRLTRAPETFEVRPIAVLKKSLEHVKKQMRVKDYRWICEQFKSIRQDLTVQCVEDEFAATVYETHADVALDHGDFEEFHQCQSQLMRLHKEGFGAARRLEFIAYRILYYMFTLDFLGISSTMATLRTGHKEHPCIRFALDLRSSWSMNNYQRFFRLLYPAGNVGDGQLNVENSSSAPGKCRKVVEWFITRERKEAAKTMFKVFRPTLSLSFVAASLGFTDDEIDQCETFLVDNCGLTVEVLRPREKMDCKVVWSAFCEALSA